MIQKFFQVTKITLSKLHVRFDGLQFILELLPALLH